jgi:hypothetical protein
MTRKRSAATAHWLAGLLTTTKIIKWQPQSQAMITQAGRSL